MMSRLKRFGYIILWALFGIFIGGWLTYTTVLLWGDQQLSNAYIAIGTLILAAATAILAFLSWRNIKSGYDKEKRDRKERWLNEIVEWAQDVDACGTNIGLPVNIKFTTDLVIDNLNKVTFLEYVRINNRGAYIEAIAYEVFTEDLYETIHKIILKLNGVIYIRGKIIDSVEKEEKEPLFD
ncbi:MAG TPA: hypothetical protein VMW60_03485, partial [Dehalococcoidales bacterium]|nr:hypothetical protein [Dehalococcoidales bacterium]